MCRHPLLSSVTSAEPSSTLQTLHWKCPRSSYSWTRAGDLPSTQHTSSAFCQQQGGTLGLSLCPVTYNRMNVSSFTSKENNLQGTKSFPRQEIESYSNSTKIMGAEEMHIIRARWTENGLGETDQWLHLLQLKKGEPGSFQTLGCTI